MGGCCLTRASRREDCVSWHCRRPAAYALALAGASSVGVPGRYGKRGEPGEEWVFEIDGDDGRTYILRLNADDVDALRKAGIERTFQAALGLGAREGE